MRFFAKTVLTLAIVAVAGTTWAQEKVTVKDPAGPVPDPTHVPYTLPENLTWTGEEGVQQTAVLFGDPGKPGPYGLLLKWYPGNFSLPHFHDQDRYIYVISGTWWVSASNAYDEKTTYPLHAGTAVKHVKNTVHWDGCRAGETEPAVLELVGMGPVTKVEVDENGKPKPPE